MKRASYWLAGALALLAALTVVAVVALRRPSAQTTSTRLPTPVASPVFPKSQQVTPKPSPTRAAPPMPAVSAGPRPTEHPREARGEDSPVPDGAPRSADTPAPDAVASVDPFAGADAALEKLDWGQMAFDVPERLRQDQTALIQLLVSPNQTVEQLTATIRAQATVPVRVEPARIQISDLMEAKLVGAAFDIQPITPEEPQMISHAQPTEWKWEIRPRQIGRQSLHLTLNVIIRYDDEKHSRAVRTFDRVIEVEVAAAPSADERSRRWWLPIIGLASLAALAGGAVMFFRRRGRRPGNAPGRSSDRNEIDLFISYSRRDHEQALALVGRLQAVGYRAWIDQRGIDGATLWAQEITEAIRRSKACVLFASAASFGSANVARELSLACDEGKPILPLLLEPAEVPSALRFQLAGIQHIELFRGDAEENFQKVLRALERLGVVPPATTDAR